MKNKALVIILAILCALLILETGYLIGNRGRVVIYRMMSNYPSSIGREQNNKYPVEAASLAEKKVSSVRNNNLYWWNLAGNASKNKPKEIIVNASRIDPDYTMIRCGGIVDADGNAIGPYSRYYPPQAGSFSVNSPHSGENDYFPAEDPNVIKVNLSGFNKEDIKIEVKDRYLIIRASKKQEASVNKKGVREESLSAANFVQSIMLPEGIKPEQIKSEFKEGTLAITIPKIKKEGKVRESAVSIPVK